MKKFLLATTVSMLLFSLSCKNDSKDDTTNLLLLLVAASKSQTINYNSDTLVFVKNSASSVQPIVTNGTSSDEFTITPNLSNSLAINSGTGTISGTPTQSQTRTAYIVAINSGKTTAKFDLIVENNSGSGRCNTNGVAAGCPNAKPYSCADQVNLCYTVLSDCKKDSRCY
ncbi:Ig domain protein [Leptospira santarosai]|nr:Ig domain protein [Leptospira santarosai]MDI7186077.1 Ig domain protein [Leptospira santarosai]MDI7189466.1 Ig domain protein [Leptospira santarosai]MDI7201342.1 Ig domain protein [Leptospira santarosai]MDI7207544.1 Ig domain protein [Leptospira santarosai]MDI7221467.1 Ig domain protein [Leptospira santarosai]